MIAITAAAAQAGFWDDWFDYVDEEQSKDDEEQSKDIVSKWGNDYCKDVTGLENYSRDDWCLSDDVDNAFKQCFIDNFDSFWGGYNFTGQGKGYGYDCLNEWIYCAKDALTGQDPKKSLSGLECIERPPTELEIAEQECNWGRNTRWDNTIN